MARRLAGTVIIDGTDDEYWPQSDEKVHRTFTINTVLNADQPASRIEIPDVRWGGECRVELDLTARVEGRGVVQVEGNGRLFEGTSENTDDKEDEKVFTFTIPRNTVSNPNTTSHRINLRNSGTGGGDHAEISLTLTNSIIEED